MKAALPKPPKEAMIYQDDILYVCLASYPITKGNVVIVMKDKKLTDLHLIAEREYDYLMDTVNAVRNALMKTLKVRKVYLIYMDEARHVHWHLVPRYNEKGYDIFDHKPKVLKDFSLAKKIKKNLVFG